MKKFIYLLFITTVMYSATSMPVPPAGKRYIRYEVTSVSATCSEHHEPYTILNSGDLVDKYTLSSTLSSDYGNGTCYYNPVEKFMLANVDIPNQLDSCIVDNIQYTCTYLPEYGNGADNSCESDGNLLIEMSGTADIEEDDYYACFTKTPINSDSNTTGDTATTDTGTGDTNTTSGTGTGDSSTGDTTDGGTTDTGTNDNTGTTDNTTDNTTDTTGTDSSGGSADTGSNDTTVTGLVDVNLSQNNPCQTNAHLENDVCICDDGYYDNGFGWCFQNAPDLPETSPIDTNSTNGIDINLLVDAINNLNNQNHLDTMNVSNRNHEDLSSIDHTLVAISDRNHLDLSTINSTLQNALGTLNDNLTSSDSNNSFDDSRIVQANNNTTQAVDDLLNFFQDKNGTSDLTNSITDDSQSSWSTSISDFDSFVQNMGITGDELEIEIKAEIESQTANFTDKSKGMLSSVFDDLFTDIFNPFQPLISVGSVPSNFTPILFDVEISSIDFHQEVYVTKDMLMGDISNPNIAKFYEIMQKLSMFIAVFLGFLYLIRGVADV